ncbi:hypothetical protein C0214_19905 [Methylobacterium sp. DM1]|nr:hypothetical protein C0214_19905 [Methylobacterium sp. DM1]
MSQTRNYQFYEAVHRDWRGRLMLDVVRSRAVHVESGAEGSFTKDGSDLRIEWDSYPADNFRMRDGIFCDLSAPLHLLAARPNSLTIPNRPHTPVTIDGSDLALTSVLTRVPLANEARDVRLRLGTSDAYVFRQVFGDREYDVPGLPERASVVFDLGSNIGLAALFFADKYPGAKIVSVEPDPDNFAMLRENTIGVYGIETEQAAVWTASGTISFATTSETGEDLGAWGGQTLEAAAPSQSVVSVRAISIPDLMSRYGVERIDVLKVDIEGAELELFSRNASWLEQVDMVLVETHDRFKPGTEAAVRDAVRADFVELPQVGENIVFRRRGIVTATSQPEQSLKRTLTADKIADLPVFVMHYTPLAERRAMMDRQLALHGLSSAVYIEEYDREAIGPEDMSRFYRNDPARHREMTDAIGNRFLEAIAWHPEKQAWHEGVDYSRPHVTPYAPMSGSEISLCCKHAIALERASRPENEITLMLEDDAILCDDFTNRMIANLDATPPDWDIIFPGSALGTKAPGRREGQVAYLMNPPHVRCSDSYLITRAAAARLYKSFVPFTLPYDFELMYWLNKLGFKTYWWEPSLVVQGSENGAFSSALR